MLPPIHRKGLGDDTQRYIRRVHGWLEWRWAPGDLCELVNMEVEPGHRSKGTGTSMIEELGATPGCRGLYGFVAAGNAGMLRLYARLGFRQLPVPDYYGVGEDGVLIWRPTANLAIAE